MKHLTTTSNIKSNTRFVSKSLDDKRIEPYIDESEQLNIKPQIGDALYLDLLQFVALQESSVENDVMTEGIFNDDAVDATFDDTFGYTFAGDDPDYSILLYGGTYTDRCGNTRTLKGLVCALNYYVWARIVKNNNYTVTRFGTVNKTDSYSENADLKERLVLEKDALNIADTYMAECLQYLEVNRKEFPLYKGGSQHNRLKITIYGE